MLKELTDDHFEQVAKLFEGFDYSLSIHSVFEGYNPGQIFVDDPDNPRTAFALTVEGYLLAGESGDENINQALSGFLRERIFSGEIYINGDTSMSLAVHPVSWERKLPEIIPNYDIEKLERYHYLCEDLVYDWRAKIPKGYTIKKINDYPLEKMGFELSEDMQDWFDPSEMWGSAENFLAKGVSFCVLHGSKVVAWCTPDCTAGDRIDVGIFTEPEYRRRELGALAVAATVDHCLEHGYRAIGWHCNADNVASWKTAEKAGFRLNRKYFYYYYMYDLVDHWAELGWYYFKKDEYQKTADYYERVFSARDDNPDYYYHLAALAWASLGNAQMALKYLNAAVDHGWVHVDWTRQQEAFSILHGMPEWEVVLFRMKRLAQQN